MTEFVIRAETESDITPIATLIARTYLAEGAQTIELVSKLRNQDDYNADLSLVGDIGNQPSAFAMFTPVKVGDAEDVAVFAGPLASDSKREDLIFSDFLERALDKVKAQSFRYVFLFGVPGMFEELGFETASDKGFEDSLKPQGVELLVKDLDDGAEPKAQGVVVLPEVMV